MEELGPFLGLATFSTVTLGEFRMASASYDIIMVGNQNPMIWDYQGQSINMGFDFQQNKVKFEWKKERKNDNAI